MALWEFTDVDGREWRAWDVRPAELHGRVRIDPDSMAALAAWAVFESLDGQDKRRLCPVPPTWRQATPELLRLWARVAEPVRADPSSEHAIASSSDAPGIGRAERRLTLARADDDAQPASRTFRYPGGRWWTVREQSLVTRAGAEGSDARQVVLRFDSGSRQLELAAPASWRAWSDDELADVLHRAFPRSPAAWRPAALERRRGDARSA